MKLTNSNYKKWQKHWDKEYQKCKQGSWVIVHGFKYIPDKNVYVRSSLWQSIRRLGDRRTNHYEVY